MSGLSNGEVSIDSACQGCGYQRCVWETFKDDNEEYLCLLRSKISEGRRPGEVRKLVYRDITRSMHGTMGSGVRRKLPNCVEDNVRRMFPSNDGKYMGYKDKWGVRMRIIMGTRYSTVKCGLQWYWQWHLTLVQGISQSECRNRTAALSRPVFVGVVLRRCCQDWRWT